MQFTESLLMLLKENIISRTNLRRLRRIINSALCVPGKLSLLSIARIGLISYRSTRRFFRQDIRWHQIRLTWLTAFLNMITIATDEVWVLVFDATTIKRAGKKSYGIGKYYCSTVDKSVNGISVLLGSVVGMKSGLRFPLLVEQIIDLPEDEAYRHAENARKQAAKGKPRGRQKGTKNKTEQEKQDLKKMLTKTPSYGH